MTLNRNDDLMLNTNTTLMNYEREIFWKVSDHYYYTSYLKFTLSAYIKGQQYLIHTLGDISPVCDVPYLIDVPKVFHLYEVMLCTIWGQTVKVPERIQFAKQEKNI